MQRYFILLLVIVLYSNVLGKDLPVKVEELFYTNYDTESLGMANVNSAFWGKAGLETNPASLVYLKKTFYNIVYSYSEFADIYAIEINNPKSFNYLSFSSLEGGIYYKKIEKEKVSLKYKYNIQINEFGLSKAQMSPTTRGFSTGLNLKLYFGNALEGQIQNDEIDLIIDKGFGAGFDMAFYYKKENVSTALIFDDLYSKIFFTNYADIKIPGKMVGSLGLDFNLIKYGFSYEKVFLNTAKPTYNNGVELILIKLPETLENTFFKGLKVAVRSGISSDKFIKGDIQYSYGAGIENHKYHLNVALVSKQKNPLDNEENVYRVTFGGKI